MFFAAISAALSTCFLFFLSAGTKVSVILCSFGTETIAFLFLNFQYLSLIFLAAIFKFLLSLTSSKLISST